MDALDDPWDWDVDRVVRELCTDKRVWELGSAFCLPEPSNLETALRKHGIGGELLLAKFNRETIKNFLGVTVFREICTIESAILQLQMLSKQYHQAFNKPLQPRAFRTANDSNASLKVSRDVRDGTPLADAQPLTEFSNPVVSAAAEIPQNRSDVPDAEFIGRKRRKLFEPPVQGATDASLYEDNMQHQDNPSVAAETTEILDLANEATGRKRKRLAPTLITSTIDQSKNRTVPTEADNLKLNNRHNIEPVQAFRDESGRKRMVPVLRKGDEQLPFNYATIVAARTPTSKVLENGGEEALRAAKKIIANKPQTVQSRNTSSLFKGYLGRQKIPVDDLFYETSQVGELATISPSDFLHASHISSGRRLYVHHIMRNFLANSQEKVFERDGKLFSAIQPYSAHLVKKHHQPSFTLHLSTPDGGAHATRQEISKWPEVTGDIFDSSKIKPSGQEQLNASFLLSKDDSAKDDGSWDYLEKYRHMEGGDKILPVYGDSGSEGEYDVGTWKEIEGENGVTDRPKLKSQRKPLTPNEIDQTIDEGTAELVIKWAKNKLPKHQRNTWKVWKKSRRDNTKRVRIVELQKGLDRIKSQRLVVFWKILANEVWTSAQQLRKLTTIIMEQSIFDRESFKWEIDMLEQHNCPARPSDEELAKLKAKKSVKNKVPEDADGDASSVSADEFDDFIVGDDVDGTDADALTNDQLTDMEAMDLDGQDGNFDDSNDSAVSPDKPRLDLPDPEPNALAEPSDVDMVDANHNEGSIAVPTRLSFSTLEPAMVVKYEPMSSAIPSKSKVLSAVPCLGPSICIDLTGDSTSSDDSPKKRGIIDLTTLRKPASKVGPILSSNSLRQETPKKFEIPRIVDENCGQNNDSDTEDDWPDSTPIDTPVPPLRDMVAIARYPFAFWQQKNDRLRLVVSVIQRLEETCRARILSFITSFDHSQLWLQMEIVMAAIVNKKSSARTLDVESFETLIDVVRIFEIYVDCQHHKLTVVILPAVVAKLERRKIPHWEGFFQLCHRINAGFADDSDNEALDKQKAATPDGDSTEDDIQIDTPTTKKSHRIFENTDARAQRDQDQQRLKEQEERRQNLHKRLGPLVSTDSTKIIINDSKFENQGLVYIHRDIAERIKKHQIDGVRFMWRQVVNDGSESIGEQGLEGCLLAHSMGLGKTMQVITLLVAIAEAAASPHESISSQIPEHLRKSKTLILCPPGLINNWMDELLTWVPFRVLGNLRKIDMSIKTHERFMEITQWFNNGGVLVMGYQLFRILTINAKNNISGDDHRRLEKELLQGPNLIIADEAHLMKNPKSSITIAANRFKSKNRIALTGSPLANNITEYHTMIDWVAPNYLGPIAEFRAKYVDPIEIGLYIDSIPGERRKALKMLRVLKDDLSPKVNRADMSVLLHNLPPKTEFVMTLALTELQSRAYSIYVERILSRQSSGGMTKMSKINQTKIWHWLTILILLCNHPSCFKNKLIERREDAQAALAGKDAQIRNPDVINSVDILFPWKVGATDELVRQEMQLFSKIKDIGDIKYSKKVQILVQILDFCREVCDKVLVFSSSIMSLDYLENLCKTTNRIYQRLDGSTNMDERQMNTKSFNLDNTELYLVSTKAGGLGLNLFGANRVVIFDFLFNPVHEEQAIGRAYRISQQKPVYVYRFVMGGTFEDYIHNKTVFKKQLASSVVDRNPLQAMAKKKRIGDFLFHPKDVEVKDITEFHGIDKKVLDRIMDSQDASRPIRSIVQEDSFQRHDNEELTAEEKKEVEQMLEDEKLKRRDPIAYATLVGQRYTADQRKVQEQMASTGVPMVVTAVSHGQHTSPDVQHGNNRASRHAPLLVNATGSLLVNHASSASQSPAPSLTTPTLSGSTLQPVLGANTKILTETSNVTDPSDAENPKSTDLIITPSHNGTRQSSSAIGLHTREKNVSGSSSRPGGSQLTLADRIRADKFSRSPRWPHAWEIRSTSDSGSQPVIPSTQQSKSGIEELLKTTLDLAIDKASSSRPRDLPRIERMSRNLGNCLINMEPQREKRENAAKALATRFINPAFTKEFLKAYDTHNVYNFLKDFTDTLRDSSSTTSSILPRKSPQYGNSAVSSHTTRPVLNQSTPSTPTIPTNPTKSSRRSSSQSQSVSHSHCSRVVSSDYAQSYTAREPISSQRQVTSNLPVPHQACSTRFNSATPQPSESRIQADEGVEQFVNDIDPLNDEDQKSAVRVLVSRFEKLLKDDEDGLTLALKGRSLYLKLSYDISMAVSRQYPTKRGFRTVIHELLKFLNENHDFAVDLATQKRSTESLIASIKPAVVLDEIKPIKAVEIYQAHEASQLDDNSSNLSHTHAGLSQ